MSTKVFSPTTQVFPRKKLYFYPDQTGLAAATALAAVGEELRVGHGAEVQAEDMAGQEPGVFQLAAGEAPEVQGAAGRVKPGGVVWAPFLREVGKLSFVRSQAGAAYGQHLTGVKAILLAEAARAAGGEGAAVAAPTGVQGGHVASTCVGQEDGLAVGGLDAQSQTGAVGSQAVALGQGGVRKVRGQGQGRGGRVNV